MADFDPIEIRLDLVQNVDSEGKKSTAAINEIAAASNAMKAQFEKDIAAQRALVVQLTTELKALQETMNKKVDQGDGKQAAEKQKLIDQIDMLNLKLLEQGAILERLRQQPTTKVATDFENAKKEVDGVTGAVKQSSTAMKDAMGDFATQSAKQMKESIAIQKQAIKELEQEIKKLQQTSENSTGRDKSNANILLGRAKSDLAAEQAALIEMQKLQVAGNATETESQKPLLAGLGKWVLGLASVAAAMKIGKSIIESTESTAHVFEQGIEAAGSATHYFFQTIASGDWNNFWQGLDKAIQGATDYVDVMEKVQNMRNQDKLTTPVVDKQIADAYIEITNKVGKTGEQQLTDIDNYLGLIKTKYLPLIETSKVSFDALLNKASSGTGGKIEAPKIQEFLEQYRSLEKMLQTGEEYNKLLEDSKALQKEMMRNPQSAQLLLPKYEKEINELNKLGDAGKNAGKYVNEIKLIPLDLRGEIADAGKEYKGLIATMEGDGKRMQMRRGSLEVEIQKDKENVAKKAKEFADKKSKEQIEYDTTEGRQRIATKIETDQKLLNAQKDGAEKQRQQAELDYQKELLLIANKKEDQLKKMNIASGGIDEKSGKPTAKYVATLPAEVQKSYDNEIIATETEKNGKINKINEKEAEKIKQIWQEVTDYRLKGIEKEKAAIKDYYNKRENDVINAKDINAKDKGDLLAGIAEMRNQKNTEIDNKYALQKIDSEEKLQYQVNEIQATGLNRRAKLEKLNFDTWVKNQMAKAAILEKSDDPKDRDEAVSIKNKVVIATDEQQAQLEGDILNSARQFTDELISQLGLTEEQTKQLQGMANIIQNLAKGGPAGYVSAAIGALSLVNSFLDMSDKKTDEAKQKALEVQQKQANYLNEMISLQVQYNLALNDQIRLQEGQTFFINDYVSQALNASNALIDIQTKYNDFLNSLQKTNPLGLGWMGDPSASEEQKKLTNALSFSFVPSPTSQNPNKMESLMSKYPALIDENGKFNAELAKTLLNIQGLPDATKVALEGLIDYTDKLKENQEAINSAVESLAGSIGNDLYSALSNAWDQGTDSFMAFKDSVSKGLKDIVKQMLFNAVFSNSLKTLQTDLIASFSVGGDQNPVNDFSTFLNAAPELLKAWSEGMKGLDSQLTAAGIDPNSASNRTGTAKGIAQASQDSVDELNGRMTAVQAYIYDIRNINQQTFDFEKESRYYDSAILSQLETIAENTDYCRYLEKIDKTLNDIQLKGVKLKN